MTSRTLVAGGAVAAAIAGLLVAAGPADAAQSVQPVSCTNGEFQVRTNNNNSSDNGGWSSAQVVDKGGHFIPTSFVFSLVDVTNPAANESFVQGKGGGNGNNNQQTVTCQVFYAEGTASDLNAQGADLPPNVAPTDYVQVSFAVTAIPKLK
jgi:hypothetical protein